MTDTNPPSSKPIVEYDGNCQLCARKAVAWQIKLGDCIDFRPSEAPLAEVRFHDPSGCSFGGAEAVFRITARLSKFRRFFLWTFLHIPAFRWLAEAIYRMIARKRHLL